MGKLTDLMTHLAKREPWKRPTGTFPQNLESKYEAVARRAMEKKINPMMTDEELEAYIMNGRGPAIDELVEREGVKPPSTLYRGEQSSGMLAEMLRRKGIGQLGDTHAGNRMKHSFSTAETPFTANAFPMPGISRPSKKDLMKLLPDPNVKGLPQVAVGDIFDEWLMPPGTYAEEISDSDWNEFALRDMFSDPTMHRGGEWYKYYDPSEQNVHHRLMRLKKAMGGPVDGDA